MEPRTHQVSNVKVHLRTRSGNTNILRYAIGNPTSRATEVYRHINVRNICLTTPLTTIPTVCPIYPTNETNEYSYPFILR